MSGFTEKEIEYLQDQRLGRLATVNASGRPHVVPVAFRYNPELGVIDVGGHNLGRSKKFRDIGETGRVAFVVDDVLPPWRARGVEVRGLAEVFGEGGGEVGPGFADEFIRILPERIVGWGIDSDAYSPNSRSVGR
ncbi:MAG: PPOX class F420-dependent oxidoreductase [Rubrobacter sp.]|jgi:pyridoxamine 5'-phosphate oxidase family protein|nr:PPOX class F420-dependent oxidoreductase [Rubrobacter sp.]MBA3952908.1 PPOX class F420-dependent oxidoreductase [Rubrobacter sp.]MDQ3360320.1 PPOX class F420-dependent oxidoreductase [Actinomycetota bacterium]